ncbi:hypothetical protein JOC48_003992 [Aquibacillus albus]|uniref:Uncharacterized protein n=1 Tax=Aquibacillus albus TaxID=1168171 RepID=A0ABS2N5W4_9BACI|nr:hypothetical protein [Aquibacillus albus]
MMEFRNENGAKVNQNGDMIEFPERIQAKVNQPHALSMVNHRGGRTK